MRFGRNIVAVALFTVCCLAANDSVLADDTAERRAPDHEQIRRWIADLDNQRFLVRERATTRLGRVGEPAIKLLAETADGDKLEAATRAVRILLSYAERNDTELAFAALTKLASLKNRPAERAGAEMVLAEIRARRAQAAILRLGGERATFNGVSVRPVNQSAGELTWLKLSAKWKGGDEGLKHINELRSLVQLSVYNSDVTDAGIGRLNHLPSVMRIELYGTKVTPEGIAELRKRCPHVAVDVRGGAQLGVQCDGAAARTEILGVQPNSAADAAGLARGDVITEFNNNPITDFRSLTARIAACQAGQKVQLKILRGGQAMEIKAVLGQWR